MKIGTISWLFALLFTGLKLTGYIDWRWLWVFSPVWGVAIGLLVYAFSVAIYQVFFESSSARTARLLREYSDALTRKGRQ